MSKKLTLIGGGGHALSLLDILPSPLMAAGYVDFTAKPDMPVPYLCDDKTFIESFSPDEWEIMVTFVSGPSCELAGRRRIIESYRHFGAPAVIAPSAITSPSSTIGSGTAVFHRAVVNAGTSIGRHCVINTGAIIEHDCHIGDNVFIGPGAIICGGVRIGDNSYISAGTIIIPGTQICDGCITGAGATVVKNLSQPGTYVGIPARRIK